LLIVFGVGITTLKFKEGASRRQTALISSGIRINRRTPPSVGAGFVALSEHEGALMISLLLRSDGPTERPGTVLPKPPDLWSQGHQHTLLALFFVFSVAWALEQCVTLFWPALPLLMAPIW